MKLTAGGYLAFYLPGRKSPVEVPVKPETRLLSVLDALGIPLGEVNLVAVNGRAVDLHTAVVGDEDEVHVVSAVDGG